MRIAGVQMDVTLGDVAGNTRRMLDCLTESRREGAELTIFPECALTGYCFDSVTDGRSLAERVNGPSAQKFVAACRELGGFAIFGMLEPAGEGVFNTAVLVGPDSVIASYRKIHIPYLGIDRFTTYGDRPFEIHSAGELNVGLAICYDSAFPEASRVLSLAGADLIALPTNFPAGAECMVEHVVHARAMENAVYFAAINRVGTERGFTFIGQSKICGPQGATLAAANATEETILYADVDPTQSRNKRIVRRPDEHAIDRHADRRPELYHSLIEPHTLPRPGRD